MTEIEVLTLSSSVYIYLGSFYCEHLGGVIYIIKEKSAYTSELAKLNGMQEVLFTTPVLSFQQHIRMSVGKKIYW